MSHLNVCVMGVGGVGGYFGGKLAYAFSSKPDSSVNIFFVARGKHLEAIKKNGLVLKSPEFGSLTCRPVLATDRINDLPPIHLFYDAKNISRGRRWFVFSIFLNGTDSDRNPQKIIFHMIKKAPHQEALL